ncbi:phage holin family protein [Candidatus Saccharibacteria bacterium]|nr:phage holin family protein [Candidatus Saccharibacteria bacterium]
MNKPFFRFMIRWIVCGLGLWIAAGLLGGSISYNERIPVIVVAGLVLAIVNTLIKPIVVLLSLPAILFSLGLFMIVVNGLMVMLASALYSQLEVNSFSAAMLAGVIIGIVNYLVTTIIEEI